MRSSGKGLPGKKKKKKEKEKRKKDNISRAGIKKILTITHIAES